MAILAGLLGLYTQACQTNESPPDIASGGETRLNEQVTPEDRLSFIARRAERTESWLIRCSNDQGLADGPAMVDLADGGTTPEEFSTYGFSHKGELVFLSPRASGEAVLQLGPGRAARIVYAATGESRHGACVEVVAPSIRIHGQVVDPEGLLPTWARTRREDLTVAGCATTMSLHESGTFDLMVPPGPCHLRVRWHVGWTTADGPELFIRGDRDELDIVLEAPERPPELPSPNVARLILEQVADLFGRGDATTEVAGSPSPDDVRAALEALGEEVERAIEGSEDAPGSHEEILEGTAPPPDHSP